MLLKEKGMTEEVDSIEGEVEDQVAVVVAPVALTVAETIEALGDLVTISVAHLRFLVSIMQLLQPKTNNQ